MNLTGYCQGALVKIISHAEFLGGMNYEIEKMGGFYETYL